MCLISGSSFLSDSTQTDLTEPDLALSRTTSAKHRLHLQDACGLEGNQHRTDMF